MPIANPQQKQKKFWFKGQPFGGAVKRNARPSVYKKFWFNGQPYLFVLPPRPPKNSTSMI
ncbi:MAG: hypothetical protein EBU90_29255 [Proteobacteria bacterium]|nr:hypothetical protein [Pseudomonadota bacterium]